MFGIQKLIKKILNAAKNKVDAGKKEIIDQTLNKFDQIKIIFYAISTLLGIYSANHILQYDGKEPINIFIFLILFLFLPLSIYVVLSIVVMLKFLDLNSFKKIVPYSKTISLCATFFMTASIPVLLLKVSFTDMAFGWSTTLNITPHFIHQLTSIISLPWSFLSEEFVPSLEFIEKSQFVRHTSGYLTSEYANLDSYKNLGKWWKFVFVSIVTYGIIPRLILLGLTSYFQIKRTPHKVDSRVTNAVILNFNEQDISTYFTLNYDEIKVYYSIIEGMILSDIAKESDSNVKNSKQDWLSNWKKIAHLNNTSHDPLFFDSNMIIESFKISPTPKALKILADASLYTPYHSLSENNSIKIDNINFLEMENYLKNLCDSTNLDFNLIKKYKQSYQDQINEEKIWRWTKLATIMIGGTAILAITGGFAAPYIGSLIGGTFGLSGASAISAGLAYLGMGALSVGGAGVMGGTTMIIGGGGLLGGLTSGLIASKLYDKNHEIFNSDLFKIISMIDCSFLNSKHFQQNYHTYQLYLESEITKLNISKEKKLHAIATINSKFLKLKIKKIS